MTNQIPDFSGKRQFETKLPILISSRIRLNDEQRLTLRQAFNKLRADAEPAAAPAIGGSSVKTVTAYNPIQSIGLSDLVLSDLLGTRESIPLTTIIKIQRLLKVEVITADDILKAAQGYVNYVFQEEREHE